VGWFKQDVWGSKDMGELANPGSNGKLTFKPACVCLCAMCMHVFVCMSLKLVYQLISYDV